MIALDQGEPEGSLIDQFDVISVLNAAYEIDDRAACRIAVEHDLEQLDHGPFAPDPRPLTGLRFVVHEEPMDDEGLARFRGHLEEIRARRAVVRRVWWAR